MAINKIEIQNSKGDVYYPHTSSDVVKHGTNSTVKAELDKLPTTYLRAIQYQAGNNGYLKLSNGDIEYWAKGVANGGSNENAQFTFSLPSGLFKAIHSIVLTITNATNVYGVVTADSTTSITVNLRATVHGGGLGVGLTGINLRVRGV